MVTFLMVMGAVTNSNKNKDTIVLIKVIPAPVVILIIQDGSLLAFPYQLLGIKIKSCEGLLLNLEEDLRILPRELKQGLTTVGERLIKQRMELRA